MKRVLYDSFIYIAFPVLKEMQCFWLWYVNSCLIMLDGFCAAYLGKLWNEMNMGLILYLRGHKSYSVQRKCAFLWNGCNSYLSSPCSCSSTASCLIPFVIKLKLLWGNCCANSSLGQQIDEQVFATFSLCVCWDCNCDVILLTNDVKWADWGLRCFHVILSRIRRH